MKHFSNYNVVVAIKEKSAGNESIGDMWIETATFSKSTPVKEIIEWAKDAGGRLIITIDESSAKEEGLDF